MKAWVIKSGDKYLGSFGRHSPLVEAFFYRTRKELLDNAGLCSEEQIIKVEIKEIKNESICN